MATALNKPVKRAIPYVDKRTGMYVRPLNVILSLGGICLHGGGTQRKLYVTWEEIAKAAAAPPCLPARFVTDKLQWLVGD